MASSRFAASVSETVFILRALSASTLPSALGRRCGLAFARHVRPKNGIHARLVARSCLFEPIEHVLIDAQGDCLFRGGNHELSFIPEILWQVSKLWRCRPSDLGFRHSAQTFQVRTTTCRARRLTRSLLRSVCGHG